MGHSFRRKGSIVVALGLLFVALSAGQAGAAEFPYIFDPGLSLKGDCTTAAIDMVPDPSCEGEPPKYPAPPNGPSSSFTEPRAIAVDGFGNEYVLGYTEGGGSGRIDIFDDEGKFLTEFTTVEGQSIAVDGHGQPLPLKSSSGEIVRYAPAAGYDPEAGNIEYTAAAGGGGGKHGFAGIAVDAANDHLLITQEGSVRIFASAAAGNGLLETLTTESTGGKIRG